MFSEQASHKLCAAIMAREAPAVIRMAMTDAELYATVTRFVATMVAFDRSMSEQGIDTTIRTHVLIGVVRHELANLERAQRLVHTVATEDLGLVRARDRTWSDLLPPLDQGDRG